MSYIGNDYDDTWQYDDEPEMDVDYPDPEMEDAENNHGQPPEPASEYYENITPKRCSDACDVWVYEYAGCWYNYNTGIAHTCGYDPEVEDHRNDYMPTMEYVLGKPKENTMNNVKVIQRPTRGISAQSLKIGEFARISEPTGDSHIGDIVLKTRTNVVNITNPNVVWDSPFSSPFVERLNTGDTLQITVGLTTDFETRIRDIAKNNNKILAIKEVREATNWGLKESKEYVESLMLQF